MPDNILIDFTADASGLQPAENALDALIAQSGELGQAWEKTTTKMDAATKVNTTNTTNLGKAIQKLSDATKTMDKAVIGGAYKDYLKQIQTQLGLTNKEVVAYIQNARTAAQQAIFSAQTQEEADALTMSIEAMNEQLAELAQAEEAAGSATTSLRARLRAAKEELVAMADAGLQGTPAFAELQERAGQLDDEMRDLNATITGLGSDTKNIDGLISIASGVAGGFALAQGAAALFGDESEEMQKALLKVNAAMSVLQGLQQIQNVLQKESAAMLFLAGARTKALAVANQFLAVTTLETAAASNVLRAALIATGIGAFVVLLGLAANAAGLFSDKQETAAEATERLAKATEALNVATNQYIEYLDDVNKLNVLKAKAAGKTEAEITAIEKAEIQKRIDIRSKAIDDAISKGLSVTEQAKANSKDIQALQELDLNEQIKNNEKSKAASDKLAEDAKKKNEENDAKRRAFAEANAKAEYEIKKRAIERLIELDNKVVNDDEKDNFLKLLALQNFLTDSLKLVEVNRTEELRQDELTATQRKNINYKFNLEKLRTQEEYETKRIALVKSSAALEKAEQEALLADLIDGEAARFARIQEGINQIYATISQNNSKEQDEDLALLEQQYKKGLITYEEYERKRALIKAEYARRILGNELAMLEAQRAANIAAGKSVIDIDKAIYAARDALRQADIDKEKAANEQKAADKKESDDKQEQLARELKDAAINLGNQTADAIFQAGADRRASELQERLSALDTARQAELDNKNLTEQQKADINRKYQEKEKVIKREAFIADREAKKRQAIINGLLAFTAALPNFVLAGAALLSAGIQAVNIQNEPIPKFRHGKVGIEGPGTTTSDSIPAMISRGESVINAKATSKWKDALESINNNDFESYLARRFGDFVFPQIPDGIQPVGMAPAIDYKLLAKEMAAEMKGIMPGHKSTHVNIDRDGIKTIVIDGTNRTEYKNKRYSMT